MLKEGKNYSIMLRNDSHWGLTRVRIRLAKITCHGILGRRFYDFTSPVKEMTHINWTEISEITPE